MLRSYTELNHRHSGQTAFICGAGSSFLDCLQHPLFHNIHNHVVLSVNASLISMPWETGSPDRRYWVSNDIGNMMWSYSSKIRTAKMNRVVRDSWAKFRLPFESMFYYPRRPTSEDVINSSDAGLAYCSSVPSALDLSIYMGCKTVYLLGVDQYFKDGKSHYWEFLPLDQQPRRRDGKKNPVSEQTYAFEFNVGAFSALKDYADSVDVKVFNCSLESKINSFPKVSFGGITEIQ